MFPPGCSRYEQNCVHNVFYLFELKSYKRLSCTTFLSKHTGHIYP